MRVWHLNLFRRTGVNIFFIPMSISCVSPSMCISVDQYDWILSLICIPDCKRAETWVKVPFMIYSSNVDSNQPAHPRSLIWVFVVRMKKLCMHPCLSKMHPVKILIRLRECTGWSESSLGAHVRRFVGAQMLHVLTTWCLCICLSVCSTIPNTSFSFSLNPGHLDGESWMQHNHKIAQRVPIPPSDITSRNSRTAIKCASYSRVFCPGSLLLFSVCH